MAGQQRRLAHASKRDSTAMKTISLLGAVFLPGTLISSLFSMTFFDFSVGDDGGSGSQSDSSPANPAVSSSGGGGGVGTARISQWLWVYFAITVPLTVIIVGGWMLLDRRMEKKHALEDEDIEKGIEKMETEIMAVMRKRTMNKATTWNSGSQAASIIQLTKKEG
jgi:hypothetical protein